jgi:NADPH2:quinone reductase
MKALVFSEFGGPEVLSLSEVPNPVVAPGTALVRMHAIGLNFADVYRRKGHYHLDGPAPWIAGYEGAGVIEALGSPRDGVVAATAFQVGDRVGFADAPRANAELVCVPVDRLIPLPSALSFEMAAASLLQGLTAHFLVNDSRALRQGEVAVIHAAAGGVGGLLVQMAKQKGAMVLAVTSTREKAQVASGFGADVSILASDDWVEHARAMSNGKGADVVYDSVGATLERSLTAARVGGQVVFYGMAGGNPAFVDPRRLMDESKTLTGGDLWNVLTSSAERLRRAAALFALMESGQLSVPLAARFPLARGADAHRHLESRTVTGKVLLIPEVR